MAYFAHHSLFWAVFAPKVGETRKTLSGRWDGASKGARRHINPAEGFKLDNVVEVSAGNAWPEGISTQPRDLNVVGAGQGAGNGPCQKAYQPSRGI